MVQEEDIVKSINEHYENVQYIKKEIADMLK